MKFEWLSSEDHDKINYELHYLDSVDPIVDRSRDTESMDFNPIVLHKYRSNKLVDIGPNYINFLLMNGKIECGVSFYIYKGKPVVRAKEFCYIPEKERKHWFSFIIDAKNQKPR